ncbi:hypothetical protein F4813DRAFT_91766 [Daldinia decipiens]|uniref:uncharacterized protein n=1 Tax=Daldinia decipiens TaxID=326647 RepID=UPI0020C1CE42|nr:uncharacterized protein F4813DRAFT_91766 [Daldinia decipiens]KAI1657100.1 hypothetical protein F4813DRAFT_91766 [Daldinia decipiens]
MANFDASSHVFSTGNLPRSASQADFDAHTNRSFPVSGSGLNISQRDSWSPEGLRDTMYPEDDGESVEAWEHPS